MKRSLVVWMVVLLGGSVPVGALAGPKPPKGLAWAMEAMDTPANPAPQDAAVVLLDEVVVTPLNKSGKVRKRRRNLLRVLSSEGLASQFQPIYYSGGGKLDWYRAWTIRPDGSFQEVDKKRVVDQGLSTYKDFSDSRRVILPMPNVGVGSLVALEYSIHQPTPYPQQIFTLQWIYPVARARVILELPDGWDYQATFRNIAPHEPRKEGSRLIWEFEDLPGLPGTRHAASRTDASASLALTYFPRSEAQPFKGWPDVASWADEQIAPQAKADEALRATVSQLSSSAKRDDTLRAVGSYVQELRYITVTLGRSGYIPYSAAEVFKKRYGDCKDKATLMMTMLREAGIESHPILVNTRDNGQVYSPFPSPGQFNHVILGIPLPADSEFLATVTHPELGALLMFDPTDEQTPLGDLPWTDQGTKGLLVHPELGSLLELPVLAARSNLAEREWTLVMAASGAAVVKMEGTFTGQYARLIRGWLGGRNEVQRNQAVAAALASRVPGARLNQASVRGLSTPETPVQLSVEMDIPRFSRLAGPLRRAAPV
ncbi:MAG: DUF3857 and transglutaminase domain-containing protein [Acidobacteria bacterium]|nr:DUF3857 and transglutaminase domain-containing protein [Acidobacteriota bacterium]